MLKLPKEFKFLTEVFYTRKILQVTTASQNSLWQGFVSLFLTTSTHCWWFLKKISYVIKYNFNFITILFDTVSRKHMVGLDQFAVIPIVSDLYSYNIFICSTSPYYTYWFLPVESNFTNAWLTLSYNLCLIHMFYFSCKFTYILYFVQTREISLFII